MGLLIGILSGFFGVGGGFILTPTLLLSGYDPVMAIIISLLYTTGTSISGVIAHFRLKNIIWKDAMIIAGSGIVATQIAHPFILYIQEKNVDEFFIPLFYILLLFYFAFKMLKDNKKIAQMKPIKSSKTIYKPFILILTGFAAGFLSTTLGVGGGFIIVPLLVSIAGFQTKKAVGTSLMGVLFIVIVGFLSYTTTTSIDYQFGGILVIGGLLGAQIGVFMSTIFDHLQVRKLLGLLYVFTGISMILKLLALNLSGLIVLTCFLIFLYAHMIRKYYIHKKSVQAKLW